MELVSSYEELRRLITEYRKKSVRSLTNYYVEAGKVERWIEKEQVYVFQTNDTLFILKSCNDFYRVFFFSTEMKRLFYDLETLKSNVGRPLSLELIGKDEKRLAETKNILIDAKFIRLMKLKRMCCMQSQADAEEKILYAGRQDAGEIYHILNETFDSRAEQIPEIDEINEYIDRKEIIIARPEGTDEIAALMIFERDGKTIHRRFLADASKYKEDGYGLIVFEQAFSVEPDAVRHILWVREDNVRPLRIYELFGFKFDGLCDEIFWYEGQQTE